MKLTLAESGQAQLETGFEHLKNFIRFEAFTACAAREKFALDYHSRMEKANRFNSTLLQAAHAAVPSCIRKQMQICCSIYLFRGSTNARLVCSGTEVQKRQTRLLAKWNMPSELHGSAEFWARERS